MQKSILAIAFFFSAALPASTLAQAMPRTEQQQREVFQQRYAKMESAMTSRDPDAIASLLAPGFTSVDPTGATQTAGQMIQDVVAMPQDPNKKSQTTIVSVASDNSRVIVVQRYHMTTSKAVPGTTHQRAIDLVATSTDTWLQIKGAWLMERTVTEQFDYTIDGKLVAHQVQPSRQ